jgi:ribonuclease R
MGRKKRSPGGKSRLLFEDVLDVLNNDPGKSWNYRQLAAAMNITDKDERRLLGSILEDFARKGFLEEIEPGKYRSKSAVKIVEGKVDTTQSGTAYVSSPEASTDIFIPARYINGALHGDIVRVKLFARKRTDGREEGEIIEIVRRNRTDFACTLHIENRVAFGVADNKKIPDFIIQKDKIGKAKDGQKVVVRMISWEDFSDLPQGEVIAVLGNAGENDTEINAIMVEYGLPYQFPKDVERAAGLVKTEITEDEIARRRDFREITTFTIDPFDAKDFDDALSVRPLSNGNWEVGVHIADVSHYVKPGSMLDREGLERATSVYLVDRVVPMLPEVLSNFVCSLRPDEEKLTFSAVFELDMEANVKSEWFGRTIIKSNRRFTYEEVQEILEGKEGDFKKEIHLLDGLAKKMRADRLRKGSITFERAEVKFHLDEAGNPTGVYFKVMKDSNQLIEDFMLLANRRVAEYATLGKKAGEEPKKQIDLRRPFVYRVHATPDPDRLKEFSTFVRTFGYRMNVDEKSVAQSLNKLLKDVSGKPEANMIETLAVRTMAKAIYTTDNIGHYGLGFHFYTHFTSPIRRYPDVMAHRLLQHYLDVDAGKKKNDPVDKNELELQCKHASDREKLAAEAERASIKYKQVQFLQDKIGKDFDGIISGVTEWGFFVELAENKCEGMVHVRTMTDDRYVFEQENYCLRGMRSGKKFSIGDKVRVLVKSADLVKKQIDFELFREAGAPRPSHFSETSGRDDWNKGKSRGGEKRSSWNDERGARGNKRGGGGKKKRK